MSCTTSGPRLPAQRSVLRAVALPSEHGGWGLTAEPVLLGLLVRPSLPGALLGAAAVTAFLARAPLKLALVDHWRRRRLPRTVVAERIAAGELALLGVLWAGAALRAQSFWWLPLVVAAPLVGVEMWFDMRSRSRRLTPELCGAVGIASVAAAIARAGGAGWAVSAGLWVVLAARSIGTVPVVRAQVLRARGRAARTGRLWVPEVLAVMLGMAAWLAGGLPWVAVAALVALSAWSLWSLRRPPLPVKVLGVTQMAIGFALVLVTAGAIGLR